MASKLLPPCSLCQDTLRHPLTCCAVRGASCFNLVCLTCYVEAISRSVTKSRFDSKFYLPSVHFISYSGKAVDIKCVCSSHKYGLLTPKYAQYNHLAGLICDADVPKNCPYCEIDIVNHHSLVRHVLWDCVDLPIFCPFCALQVPLTRTCSKGRAMQHHVQTECTLIPCVVCDANSPRYTYQELTLHNCLNHLFKKEIIDYLHELAKHLPVSMLYKILEVFDNSSTNLQEHRNLELALGLIEEHRDLIDEKCFIRHALPANFMQLSILRDPPDCHETKANIVRVVIATLRHRFPAIFDPANYPWEEQAERDVKLSYVVNISSATSYSFYLITRRMPVSVMLELSELAAQNYGELDSVIGRAVSLCKLAAREHVKRTAEQDPELFLSIVNWFKQKMVNVAFIRAITLELLRFVQPPDLLSIDHIFAVTTPWRWDWCQAVARMPIEVMQTICNHVLHLSQADVLQQLLQTPKILAYVPAFGEAKHFARLLDLILGGCVAETQLSAALSEMVLLLQQQ